ncbi:MAG: hypothetical protein HMLKMBBP_00491 [Planctomycetes bacterium]|nr:hypothetical protein [Planctomycetota bacterium]
MRVAPQIRLFLACAAAAAAAASEPVPELLLPAGEGATGEIVFDGEEDRIDVPLLAGQALTFTVKPPKGGSLRAGADILLPAGATASVDPSLRKEANGAVTIKKWPAPATGLYAIAVRGTPAGPTGLYGVTSKSKPAPKPAAAAGTATAGATAEVTVDALAGSLLTVTVSAAKGSTLVPRLVEILGPDDEPADLGATGVTIKETPTSVQAKGVLLPSFGTWRVRFAGDGGSGGGYSAKFALKAPKPSKTVRDFRGASGGESRQGALESIELVPDVVEVAAGATAPLVAKGTFDDGRVRDITRSVEWFVRNRNAATVSRTAPCGVVTGIAPGGTTVEAVSGSVAARGALVLVGGAGVGSVAVSPGSAAVPAGGTFALQATATFTGADPSAATADVTAIAAWAAGGGSFSFDAADAPGTLRAGSGAAAAADATATLDGVSGSSPVTVVAARLERIDVSPAYAEFTTNGQSRALSAVATYSDGTTANVTGSVTFLSDHAGAIAVSGTNAVRNGSATGTAGIRATLDGVTSRPAVMNAGPVGFASAAVTGASVVARGASADVAFSVTFADGGTRDVTEGASWTSDAAAVTVSSSAGTKGRVTGAASGSANVRATLTIAGTSRQAQRNVAGAAAAVRSLRIVPEAATVGSGATFPLLAMATRTDGTLEDVTGTAAWSTSDAAAVTVAGGVATGAGDGGAVVSATLDGVTGHAVVCAGAGRIGAVAAASSAVPAVGDAFAHTLRVSFLPSGGPADLPSLGARYGVDPLALAASQTTAAARRAGTTRLVATLLGVSAETGDIVIGAAEDRSLAVFPQAPSAVLAGTVQLAAQVTRSDGAVRDVAATAVWTSLHTSIATVGATGLVSAAGTGTATIRAESGALSGTAPFLVLGNPPTLAGISPTRIERGSSGVSFAITGTDLDGAPGGTASFSGAGITIASGPTVNGAGTQATMTLDIDSAAATGFRDVTWTHPGGSHTLSGALHIAAPAPTLASVAPGNAPIPAMGSMGTLVTATGTGFVAGDAIALESASGVSIGATTFVGPTTLTATVTVASTASAGRLDVSVVQSMANGGAAATLTDALKIGPADPVVSSVIPPVFLPGTTTPARIAGSGFNTGIAVTFPGAAGAGLTISGVTRTSATEITFTVAAPANATLGGQNITLQNTGDSASTATNAFHVAPRDPVILSCSAAALAKGASNVDVLVKGVNFRSGDTLAASGSDVTFSSVTVSDPETITAKVAAGSGAATGLRDVTVSHATSVGGRGATLAGALRVVNASPTVTSASPGKIGRTGTGGATRRVPIRITGTNFSAGATVGISRTASSGLTVVGGSTAVVSDTEIRADIDLTGTATTGFWDVLVTNPSSVGNSGTSGNGKLEVASESTLVVNRVNPSSGASSGGERVTVEGAGFSAGARVEFGAERAGGVLVIDQNTLVCTVPPPTNPSSGSATTLSTTAATEVDVKVTNSPSGTPASATLANGWAYAKEAGPFTTVEMTPADESTGNPQNLKSAVLRLNQPANTATAVSGTTRGTHCYWFEASGFQVSGTSIGFGADRRFLVYSRTGGGNLPINAAGLYILEIPTALKAASGRAYTPSQLAATLNYDQWRFTITTSTDASAPTWSTTPAGSATGVSVTSAVAVAFSEAIDPLTFTTSSIQLKQGANVVSCGYALSDDLRTATLTPTESLSPSTTYTIAVAATVADLCGNAVTASSPTFTTGSSTDTTLPTIDAVVLQDLPAAMDGSGTWIPGSDEGGSFSSAAAYDAYMPTHGFTIAVTFSDAGGSGADASTFSAKANVAAGGSSAGAELASKFTVTSAGASWTIASSDALAAADDVTFTFLVKDKANNTSATKTVTFDTIGPDTTAAGAGGGDHDPLDSRETWVLRFDRDVYTASYSTSGSTQQMTTAAGANGVPDWEEALFLAGLRTSSMTTDAANTVNGVSRGTNAIVARLFQERLRASLRTRFGIAEDGTRSASSVDIDLLLPGEQGTLASMPTFTSSSSSSTGNAWSEIEIGGDVVPNSSLTGTYTTLGIAFLDARNRFREANLNAASGGGNEGIFTVNLLKSVANSSTTGTTWGARVLARAVTAKGGTAVGEHSLDDDVLAGSFSRSSASNTQAMNDRYDLVMDVIEAVAMSVSGVTAHEIGHSLGLVADGGPKTGLFGDAYRTNAFTEATSAFTNTSAHLNYLGNDIMSPASSSDDRTATGTSLMRFSPTDINHLRNRQVFDEGK